MRRMAAVLVGLLLAGIGAVPTVAQAAPSSVTVGCTSGVGDSAGLVSAVNSANQGGPKTIVLGPSCTYTLTSAAENADGLPVISSSIGLKGSGSTITRDSSASRFRIVEIGSAGKLTASDVTISGGHAPDGANGANGPTGADSIGPGEPGQPGGDGTAGGNGAAGGGILVDGGGALSLSNSVVTANTAGNGGSGGNGGAAGAGPSGGPMEPGASGGNGAAGGDGGNGGGISNNGNVTLGATALT